MTAFLASLRKKLSIYGLAVEQIDDGSFHLPTAPCCVCAECGSRDDCVHNPAALDVWALFSKIRAATKIIEESSQFAKTKRGLLIMQGKRVRVGSSRRS